MANRNFKQQVQTAAPGMVLLAGVVSHQSGGVPTGDTINHVSASRLGPGLYRLHLQSPFLELLHASVAPIATGSVILTPQLSGSNVGGVRDASGVQLVPPSVDYRIVSASGAHSSSAVDPQYPMQVSVFLVLKNSNVRA